MPYIDAWYGYADFCPLEGEDYKTFETRCVAGLLALDPSRTEQDAKMAVNGAWNAHVMNTAVEITATLKRDIDPNSIYNYNWADWTIAEIHSASLPTITYSSVEKAKVDSGEEFKIAKSIPEKQLVFGWANIAKDANGNFPLDWDGDVTAPEDLESAAYTYVLKYRTSGEQHQEGSVVGHLVESIMFTKEKQQAMGIPDGILPEGWWTGYHIPDKEVFAKVKSGEYGMFSVQGKAKRVPTGQ